MSGLVFMYVVEGLSEATVLGADSMNGGMLTEPCSLLFDPNLSFTELTFSGSDIPPGLLF